MTPDTNELEKTITVGGGDVETTVVVSVMPGSETELKRWKEKVAVLYEEDVPHIEIVGPNCPYQVTINGAKQKHTCAANTRTVLAIPKKK